MVLKFKAIFFLRKYQQTTWTYPMYPKLPIWKDFQIINRWFNMFQDWNFLRPKILTSLASFGGNNMVKAFDFSRKSNGKFFVVFFKWGPKWDPGPLISGPVAKNGNGRDDYHFSPARNYLDSTKWGCFVFRCIFCGGVPRSHIYIKSSRWLQMASWSSNSSMDETFLLESAARILSLLRCFCGFERGQSKKPMSW